jgi:hypothetical protein
MEQIWKIGQMDGGDVRLRNGGGKGLLDLDVSAPVRTGQLRLHAAGIHFDLTIALDRVKTGNFLTEHAARAFIAGYRAHDLVYAGAGSRGSDASRVRGPAKAGSIDVEIELTLTPVASDWDAMTELEIVGSAGFGTVHIPLPGVGTVDDLVIDINARLAVKRA